MAEKGIVVVVANDLLYLDEVRKDKIIDTGTADLIARDNGWAYVEPFIKEHAGKTLLLRPRYKIAQVIK